MNTTIVRVATWFRNSNACNGKMSFTSPSPVTGGLSSSATPLRASCPPSTVGPISTPATICPATRGCPKRTNSAPTIQATT